MTDDLVTIATSQVPYHADLAKGMLESAGFEVYLIGYNFGRLSFFNTAFAPIRLQVKTSDVVATKKLFEDLETDAASEQGAVD